MVRCLTKQNHQISPPPYRGFGEFWLLGITKFGDFGDFWLLEANLALSPEQGQVICNRHLLRGN